MAYKEEYRGLHFEKKGHVAHITFDNPHNLNALSYYVFESIIELFDEMSKDRDVWGAILTGAGRSFIAGADLAGFPEVEYYPGEFHRDSLLFVHTAMSKIANFERPTIAAINGFAFGGGAEVSLSCDIRLASTKAKVSFPESRLGGMPLYTGPSRATRILGPTVAKLMMFTGRHFTAEEALQLGFVTYVYEPDELMPAAEALMEEIVSRSPIGNKFAKIMVDKATEMSYQASLEMERMINPLVFQSNDNTEGLKAFLNKTTYTFTNN